MKTGGLGNLSVVNESGDYQVWVCVLDDACSLGGDYFFCYVFEENTRRFVPWDENLRLNLFSPREHVAPVGLSGALAEVGELKNENKVLRQLLFQAMTVKR